MVALPRLVIAAPASGCGKTTVACGLMSALRARGLAVSGHKIGPDYIDPGYHALATGRPPRNLDPFLSGEELIVPLFRHGAAGAQVAVIEGVMGLFDGADPATVPGQEPGFGSTAHVARLLAAPVLLVLDAARTGRSVAALAAGFAAFDQRIDVAGVILNRVGSDRHERLLRLALAESGIAVFGAIRRTDPITTPSRHLGLIPAAERTAVAARAIAQLGDLIAASCALDALLALARRAPDLAAPAWDPAAALAPLPAPAVPSLTSAAGTRTSAATVALTSVGPAPVAGPMPVVAIAGGAAFTFGYTEQAELLEAAGARVVSFDPLQDEDLPAGTTGLILGGGFPEVHAAELSANERLREKVSTLARRGAPVAAECAGLLYLARSLDGQPMCGVLDADATMTATLTLGYRHAVAIHDSVLARSGDQVRGHEFHRTSVVPSHGARAAWRFGSGELEGHVAGSAVASYLHTHWTGHPAAAVRFIGACAASRSGSNAGSDAASGSGSNAGSDAVSASVVMKGVQT